MNSNALPHSILYITDYLHSIGGAERNLIQLLNGIDRKRFHPIICCLSGGLIATELRKKGFETHNLQMKRIYSPHVIKTLRWTLELIKSKRVKLIITYHDSSDFFGLLAAQLTKIPIISNRRDMGYKLKKRHLFIYRICNKYFTKIVTVSDAVKEAVTNSQKAPKNNIITIYNGVETSVFSNSYESTTIKRSLAIRDENHVVGSIGNLRQVKGHRYLIQAASIVTRYFNNVKFIIVGKDLHEPGCSKDDLISLARDLGIQDHFFFIGERKNIPELLSAMDIIVNSSISEGMSNTVLEAMAASKTVIASNVGGNPEVIKDCETGFLFPARDYEKLAEIIIYCLTNPERSHLIGANARSLVLTRHSMKVMCQQYMSLYNQCITQHKHFLASG